MRRDNDDCTFLKEIRSKYKITGRCKRDTFLERIDICNITEQFAKLHPNDNRLGSLVES